MTQQRLAGRPEQGLPGWGIGAATREAEPRLGLTRAWRHRAAAGPVDRPRGPVGVEGDGRRRRDGRDEH